MCRAASGANAAGRRPHKRRKAAGPSRTAAANPCRNEARVASDPNKGAAGTLLQQFRAAGEGIYVGRVWYTYPINGQRAGDFTCTVSGDSYLIRNGVLAAPLAPNSLRINANLEQVFAHPLGVGSRAEPALVWGAPEAYYTSALAASAIPFAAIEASQSSME